MITVSYIVLKIMLISIIYLWVLTKCSRNKHTKEASSRRSSASYIEEDTKLEEKYQRPAWDKQFPNILPPPVRVPEKENKEVDVELDMMIMSAPRLDKGSALESDLHKEIKGSDLLDPVFDDRTQASVEKVDLVETPRDKMLPLGSPAPQSQGSDGIKGPARLVAEKAIKDVQRIIRSKERLRKSKESVKRLKSKETQTDSRKNMKKKSKENAEKKQ
ncbi:hypothetical protein Y032_0425g1234 [Ancylostoma ceylanicum]|uniref:Uncharacterized protein n=1 Tax=Ancylostoma ceylanicum TaxID=53326 RepID=A0A016X0Y9_9BILA|nr:hypothetical protein Y032_0425g1234 [Ancylostoma ceylanicum]